MMLLFAAFRARLEVTTSTTKRASLHFIFPIGELEREEEEEEEARASLAFSRLTREAKEEEEDVEKNERFFFFQS